MRNSIDYFIKNSKFIFKFNLTLSSMLNAFDINYWLNKGGWYPYVGYVDLKDL